jgi:hypothetical protein
MCERARLLESQARCGVQRRKATTSRSAIRNTKHIRTPRSPIFTHSPFLIIVLEIPMNCLPPSLYFKWSVHRSRSVYRSSGVPLPLAVGCLRSRPEARNRVHSPMVHILSLIIRYNPISLIIDHPRSLPSVPLPSVPLQNLSSPSPLSATTKGEKQPLALRL